MALHETHTRNDSQGAQPHQRKDSSMTDVDTLRLLRQVEVVGRADRMSRAEREDTSAATDGAAAAATPG
jgi:hypothetical protein